jgi:hypothetical protein
MALPVVMKNNNCLLVLILFLGIIIFASFALAQNGEALIESRKRAVELVQTPFPPELQCYVDIGSEIHTSVELFPENSSEEVYLLNQGGFFYYKIENDKAIPTWMASWPVDSPEGQKLEVKNTFLNWIPTIIPVDPLTFGAQCGTLPSYDGKLEAFVTVGISEVYKGIVGTDGNLECEISNLGPDPSMGEDFYDTANCDEKQ